MREEHAWQPRGSFLRIEILDLVAVGEISPTECLLLLMVDSMVDPYGRDCYASNRWLGARLHVGIKHVVSLVHHLKKRRLLKTYTKGGQRYMRTSWSRIGRGDGPQAEGGTAYRHTHSISYANTETGRIDKRAAPSHQKVGLKKRGGAHHPRWRRYATKLAQACARGRGLPIPEKMARGSDEFRKLHTMEKVPVPRIREVLDWYCRVASRENYLLLGREKFMPVCGNGYSFRKKWDSLEGAKARWDSEHGVAEGGRTNIRRKIIRTKKRGEAWE